MDKLELTDSSLLTHIKGQFYKNKSGQLFEKTYADQEVKGIDTLVSIQYFNGQIPQEIDPLTFVQLNGWYAKDKNFAYFYRPTSCGMLVIKLDSADVKTFNLLAGHYNFAADKKHIYHQSELLNGIDLNNLKIITDEKGFVTKLISGKNSYTPY